MASSSSLGRGTRSSSHLLKVTCCHYGEERKVLFPQYFFCAPCDEVDLNGCLTAKAQARYRKNHPCEAGHNSWAAPTSVKKSYCPSKQVVASIDNVTPGKKRGRRITLRHNDAVQEPNALPVTPEIAPSVRTPPRGKLQQVLVLERENKKLQSEIDVLGREAVVSNALLKRSQQECFAHDKRISSLKAEIKVLQEKEIIMKRRFRDMELAGGLETCHKDDGDEIIAGYLKKTVVGFMCRNAASFGSRRKARIFHRALMLLGDDVFNSEMEKCIWLQLFPLVPGEESEPEQPDQSTRSPMLADTLERFLEILCQHRFRKTHAANIGKDFARAVWYGDLLFGSVKGQLLVLAREWYREHVFTPWKVARKMDMTGAVVSLKCLTVLRSLESNGKKNHRCILPSASAVQRCFSKVEDKAQTDGIAPFDTFNDNGIDGFRFDTKRTFKSLCRGFGIEQVAKRRRVDVSVSVDAARLTNNKSHTTMGLKFNDKDCKDENGMPLCLHEDEGKVQNRNLNFPLMSLMDKESKLTILKFKPVYDFFNDASTEEGRIDDYKPINVNYPADMSAQWKALLQGGAAKVKTRFCFNCNCTSQDIAKPQHEQCEKWGCVARRENDLNWCCYHHKFGSDEQVREETKIELQELMTTMVTNLKEVKKNSELVVTTDINNPKGLCFETQDMSALRAYSRFLNDELLIRGLSCDTTLPMRLRQERLEYYLNLETKALQHIDFLENTGDLEGALYLILQAIPCILHLEQRVGLKIITVILTNGMNAARKGELEWLANVASEKKRVDDFVKKVNGVMQSSVLGSEHNRSQWTLPLEADGANLVIGDINMENTKVRAVILQLEEFVSFCCTTEEEKQEYNELLPLYRESIVILRKKTDYTDEEIKQFQDRTDRWYQIWVAMHGFQGCTNYIHLLSSSHIAHYMQKWRCLHRYSQQGWEAMNALYRSYFFKRTNRAGGRSSGNYLRPIARWLQRRIMWILGEGEAIFVPPATTITNLQETVTEQMISSGAEEDEMFGGGGHSSSTSSNNEDSDGAGDRQL